MTSFSHPQSVSLLVQLILWQNHKNIDPKSRDLQSLDHDHNSSELVAIFGMIPNGAVQLKAAIEAFFRNEGDIPAAYIDQINRYVAVWTHCKESALPLNYAEKKLGACLLMVSRTC